jgi:hypothetical protein
VEGLVNTNGELLDERIASEHANSLVMVEDKSMHEDEDIAEESLGVSEWGAWLRGVGAIFCRSVTSERSRPLQSQT